MTMSQIYGDFDTAKASKISSLHAHNYSDFMEVKMHRDSHKIKKPPASPSASSSPVYRKPVIIHTYSPKVIQTEAHNFMQLVQKLTGWDAADKRKKNKKKSKSKSTTTSDSRPQGSEIISTSPISVVPDSTTLNNNVFSIFASKTLMLNNNNHSSNSYGYSNQPVSHQMSFEENNLTNAYYMADNSYASISSTDLSPHLFNMSSSAQSFYIPFKQQQQPPLPNLVADSIYINPYQENQHFLDNLPPSSAPTIGEYNFSEFVPQMFAKDFEF